MATPLKLLYSKKFTNDFSTIISEVLPAFPKNKFFALVHDDAWDAKELKQRMKHLTWALHQVLPADFQASAATIESVVQILLNRQPNAMSLEYMFLPDYIEAHGIDDFETSVRTMELVTRFTSCEFAVRPFIVKYERQMMEQMLAWSRHNDHRVRRFASEGCRPRLPWAMALPSLKKDPTLILPILENLKHDPSDFVRRSVANNLNDIAKDHPDLVISISRQWVGKNKETDALVKHGCRTLLKQGNTEVLELFGVSSDPGVETTSFRLTTEIVPVGNHVDFSFSLNNTTAKTQALRLEYAIHYLLQNGQHSKKVFKISERSLPSGEQLDMQKKHSFRPITTRKYYPGPHKLSLIVNGEERGIAEFELVG